MKKIWNFFLKKDTKEVYIKYEMVLIKNFSDNMFLAFLWQA